MLTLFRVAPNVRRDQCKVDIIYCKYLYMYNTYANELTLYAEDL